MHKVIHTTLDGDIVVTQENRLNAPLMRLEPSHGRMPVEMRLGTGELVELIETLLSTMVPDVAYELTDDLKRTIFLKAQKERSKRV